LSERHGPAKRVRHSTGFGTLGPTAAS
jgi:hypothetical protein